MLKNIRITLRGTEAPLEIVSADMRLLADAVRVEKLSAKAANSVWTGSVEMPRGCGAPADCEIHFNVKSNQAVMSDLAAWANPAPKTRPWYRVLEASSVTPSFLAGVRASGRIAAEHLQIHGLSATRVTARLALNDGDLSITELDASLLGGTYRGRWETDFHTKPPLSTCSGNLQGVSLADLAQMTKDSWISGTANATFQLTLKGISASELWETADGTMRFQAHDGDLPHLLLDDPEPLRFADFSGQARLHAKEIEIKDAKVESSEGTFLLSGVTSAKRELQFKLLRGGTARGFAISGTLADPHVSALPNAEQARLKQ